MENNLRKYRRLREYSQQTLADKVSVSRQTISNIEKGSIPAVDLAGRIAKELSIDINLIFLTDLSYKTYKKSKQEVG